MDLNHSLIFHHMSHLIYVLQRLEGDTISSWVELVTGCRLKVGADASDWWCKGIFFSFSFVCVCVFFLRSFTSDLWSRRDLFWGFFWEILLIWKLDFEGTMGLNNSFVFGFFISILIFWGFCINFKIWEGFPRGGSKLQRDSAVGHRCHWYNSF